MSGEPYALSMHPKILRRIAEQEPGFTYLWPGEVTREFKKFLLQNVPTAKDGVNVAGKNFDGLDRLFLERLPKFKEEIKLRHRVIDPAILYWQPGDETLPGTELCYQRAGLEPVAAHTAIEDALGVIQLVRKKLVPPLPYLQDGKHDIDPLTHQCLKCNLSEPDIKALRLPCNSA